MNYKYHIKILDTENKFEMNPDAEENSLSLSSLYTVLKQMQDKISKKEAISERKRKTIEFSPADQEEQKEFSSQAKKTKQRRY